MSFDEDISMLLIEDMSILLYQISCRGFDLDASADKKKEPILFHFAV
jgi:hypothetical protein